MSSDDPVRVRVALEPGPTRERPTLLITVTIAPGYHVYAEPAPEGFVPLKVTLAPGVAKALGPPIWPPPQRLEIEDLPDEFWVHHGTVLGRIPIEVTRAGGTIQGEVSYQACTDYACFLPASVPFSIPLDA